MFNLPNEVKLDLLKCLNLNQLFNFRLINFYFNDFINKNEGILTRKEFHSIKAGRMMDYYMRARQEVFELDFIKFEFCLDFQLNDQLKAKWDSTVNQSRPLFSGDRLFRLSYRGDLVITVAQRIDEKNVHFIHFKLPVCLRNVKEMKIARYFLEQLFRCYFNEIDFQNYVFVPEMIKLLFENDEIIKTQFNGHHTKLHYFEQTNVLDFAVNHLLINELNINLINYKYPNQNDNKTLFNLLVNGGARFTKIDYRFSRTRELFYSLIEYIETSTNCSNIVANIEFGGFESFNFNLNGRTKNKKKEGNILSFEVNNIYNQKIKFLFKCWEYESGRVYRVQISG